MVSKIGLGTMLDSVDFVRKTWDQLNLPTVFAPTVDIAELDKRISDLKAVEQWLNVNLSMLRGTIQGFEVQRSALEAVKAMGGALTSAPSPPESAGGPNASPLQPLQLSSAANWWNLLQDQFNQVAAAALTGAGVSAGKALVKTGMNAARDKSAPPKSPTGAGAKAPRKPRAKRKPNLTGFD